MEKTMKRPCEGPCVLTDSKIVLVRNRGEHFKAVAEITLNDSFVVRGLRIMSGTEGLFVSYPAEARDSQYRTIAGCHRGPAGSRGVPGAELKVSGGTVPPRFK